MKFLFSHYIFIKFISVIYNTIFVLTKPFWLLNRYYMFLVWKSPDFHSTTLKLKKQIYAFKILRHILKSSESYFTSNLIFSNVCNF